MSNATSLRVPKYGKHRATGQARVQIDGRTVYLGKYGSAESHEAYRGLIDEWSHGKGVVRTHAGSLSVSQLMLEYLKHARVYYRKRGKATREYEQIAECCRFIKKLYGRTVAAEFGPLKLKAVRECMIKADHSRGFINDNIDRIRRMFKWAAAEELVPASVPQALAMVAGLKRGRCEARETDPILVRDSQAYCFRPSDSEAKRRADRHASRKTPLSCGNIPGSNRVVNPKKRAGDHYDTNAYRRAIHHACDKAFPAPDFLEGKELAEWHSSQRWSPNQLRQSAATEIRKQFGLEAARVILRHASADVSQIDAERSGGRGQCASTTLISDLCLGCLLLSCGNAGNSVAAREEINPRRQC